MSHIREGELHAYLDGALDRLGPETAERVREHLSQCEDCRSRLEDERDLREQSSALLEHSLPREIVVPPFEELRQRAAVGPVLSGGSSDAPTDDDSKANVAPPGRRTVFPAWKWAWAASLVLALGTGWMMGGGSLNPTDLPLVPVRASSVESEAFAGDASADDASADQTGGFAETREQDAAVGDVADLEAQAQILQGREANLDESSNQESLNRESLNRESLDEVSPREEANEASPSGLRSSLDPAVPAQVGERRLARDEVAAERREQDAPASPPPADENRPAEGRAADTAPARARGDSREVLEQARRPAARVAEEEVRAEARQEKVSADRPAAALEDALSDADYTEGVGLDGAPLWFPDRPVVAIVPTTQANVQGVLQQLATGDSVLLVWSGAAAQAQVAGLGTASTEFTPATELAPSANPVASARGNAPLVGRLLDGRAVMGAEQDALAADREVARQAPWPTALRVQRGQEVLTVYSTLSEEELRTELLSAGLIPSGP